MTVEMEKQNFYSFENRIKSFEGVKLSRTKQLFWPHNVPTQKELADTGFYYTPTINHSDLVTCYLCGITISNWDQITLTPAKIHFKQNENCPLVNITANGEKGRFMRLKTFFKSKECCNNIETLLNRGDSLWPHDGTNWSASSTAMADAGFYYAPSTVGEDYGVCPFCGLGLDGWEAEDEPKEEHAKKSPRCQFVRANYGELTKTTSKQRLTEKSVLRISKKPTVSKFKNIKKKTDNIFLRSDFDTIKRDIENQPLTPKSVNCQNTTTLQHLKKTKKFPKIKARLNPKKNSSLKVSCYQLKNIDNSEKSLSIEPTENVANSETEHKMFDLTSETCSSAIDSNLVFKNTPEQLLLVTQSSFFDETKFNDNDYKNVSGSEPSHYIIDPDVVFEIINDMTTTSRLDQYQEFTVRQYIAHLADEAETRLKEKYEKLIGILEREVMKTMNIYKKQDSVKNT